MLPDYILSRNISRLGVIKGRRILSGNVLLSSLRKKWEFSIVVEHVFHIFIPPFCFSSRLLYSLFCEDQALQEREPFFPGEAGISTSGI